MAFIGPISSTGSFVNTSPGQAVFKSSGHGGGFDNAGGFGNNKHRTGSFEVVVRTGDTGLSANKGQYSSGSFRVDQVNGGSITQRLRLGADQYQAFLQCPSDDDHFAIHHIPE